MPPYIRSKANATSAADSAATTATTSTKDVEIRNTP